MFGWRADRSKDEVGRLIARGRYRDAWQLLRRELCRNPGSVWLRLRLADVLALERKTLPALRVLGRLSEELLADGFQAKAVAVLKKMQRLDPTLPSLGARLTSLTVTAPQSVPAPARLAA